MKVTLIVVFSAIAIFIWVLFYGRWSFQNNVTKTKDLLIQPRTEPSSPSVITESDLAKLPTPVQTWLRSSDVIGKYPVKMTHLKQSGFIRLKPETSEWTPSDSEQVINLESPGFVWTVKMNMSGLPVLGMDQFINGQGRTWITLFGLFPVANVKAQPKVNQSALQRFLGEIVWTPTAALSPYIEWTAVDDRSAKAKMSSQGVTGDAVFYFSPQGEIEKFVALRFKEITDEKPLEWHADIKAMKTIRGTRIPSSIEATWMLPEGPFTWYKFEITDLEYR